MTKKMTISGVGCCLADRLYNHISFGSEAFTPYLSRTRGDGGLTPGHLVFREEFEAFCGKTPEQLILELTGGKPADSMNIGGPGVVAIIHAAQMSDEKNTTFNFYGLGGGDSDGMYIADLLRNTPVKPGGYRLVNGITPSTVVLSDPTWEHGNGERIFINSIGVAGAYTPNDLPDSFFDSDVVVFGGTALVPQIHDHLTELLKKAKNKGCVTIVNTVFDFRNEQADPHGKWPLGESEKSYKNIDLLIADMEEALRLSGTQNLDDAMAFFREKGTGAVMVTNGSRDVVIYAGSHGIFREFRMRSLPVSAAISEELRNPHKGDTTGCGDNFAGGVIYSVISQLQRGETRLSAEEACAWGVVSGGYCCFYIGGTFMEEYPGQKRSLVAPYFEKYTAQTGHA